MASSREKPARRFGKAELQRRREELLRRYARTAAVYEGDAEKKRA